MGAHSERIVIAVPIEESVVEQLRAAAPEIDWCWEPELLPQRRFAGDYVGAPGFLRTPAAQSRFEELLDTADALFGIPDTSPAALRRVALANPRLRWVHTMAAGGGAQLRAAELPSSRRAGLVVTTSAGVHGQALAEFAILGLLAGLKGVPRWIGDQAARRWPERYPVNQLRDATVLVLGAGGVGTRVAELAGAFGARLWGVARHARQDAGPFHQMLPADGFGDILGSVDAVVSTLPGTDATTHLIDADFLSALRPGATLVSVGRGAVVDEPALIGALNSGQVGFAALDVFEREPLPPDSPLWASDRVLLSPHTAALDAGEERRIAELFLENLDRWRVGRVMRNVVDPVEFY